MLVTVEYTAQLKRAAGTAREQFKVSNSTSLLDLVDVIAALHSAELARILVSTDGTPQPTVIPFIDDNQIRWDDEDALHDGVTVTLLSPISGG
jgi:molybdopterin converting factor small subunit